MKTSVLSGNSLVQSVLVVLRQVLMQRDVLDSLGAPTTHHHPPDFGVIAHVARNPEGYPNTSFGPRPQCPVFHSQRTVFLTHKVYGRIQ